MNTRTSTERLAVIEEIVTRMETKLDKHIDSSDRRIARLERLGAWASGAFSVITSGVILYVKNVVAR
jgi:hypothetical protein